MKTLQMQVTHELLMPLEVIEIEKDKTMSRLSA